MWLFAGHHNPTPACSSATSALEDAGGAAVWLVLGLRGIRDKRNAAPVKSPGCGAEPSDLTERIKLLFVHYASGSTTAVIRLSHNSRTVFLEIEDHGKGISKDKLNGHSGVGITGMRERVRHLRGDMSIESNGSGTKVCVMLPMLANLSKRNDQIQG
jgi:hypothetical protein